MGKVILEQEQYESMLNDFIKKELYKQRIDKAIKWFENADRNKLQDLLKILRGEDNENN